MSKKKETTLPEHIYVRVDYNGKEKFLLAYENGYIDAIEGDGPTEIGIYELKKVYPSVTKSVVLGESV